jgi:SPW repeat
MLSSHAGGGWRDHERTTDQLPISKHPDIVALRERHEQAFETPQAWASAGLLLIAATYAAVSPWVVGFRTRSGGLAVSDCRAGAGDADVGLRRVGRAPCTG